MHNSTLSQKQRFSNWLLSHSYVCRSKIFSDLSLSKALRKVDDISFLICLIVFALKNKKMNKGGFLHTAMSNPKGMRLHTAGKLLFDRFYDWQSSVYN